MSELFSAYLHDLQWHFICHSQCKTVVLAAGTFLCGLGDAHGDDPLKYEIAVEPQMGGASNGALGPMTSMLLFS
jgi:hypothetical protein